MGADYSTQFYEDFVKSFSNRYNFVKEINDARFGDVHVYKEIDGNNYVFVKGYWCNSEEEYAKFLSDCARRVNQKHPNILRLIGYHQQSEAQICGDFSKITCYYEYYQHNLEKELERRHEHSEYFTEPEIWFTLDSLVSAGAALEYYNLFHADFRPINILLTNEGHVKIAEQGASSSIEKSGYFKALTYGEIVYLSPLLLKSLLRRELRPQHNPFKSDVFSLGMTMLECCALLTARSCYEYEQGRINYEVVRDFLQNASSQYSQFLINVIYEMLQEDENLRPNFLELQSLLTPYQEYIRNLQPFVADVLRPPPQFLQNLSQTPLPLVYSQALDYQQQQQKLKLPPYSYSTTTSSYNGNGQASSPKRSSDTHFQLPPQSPTRYVPYYQQQTLNGASGPFIQSPEIVRYQDYALAYSQKYQYLVGQPEERNANDDFHQRIAYFGNYQHSNSGLTIGYGSASALRVLAPPTTQPQLYAPAAQRILPSQYVQPFSGTYAPYYSIVFSTTTPYVNGYTYTSYTSAQQLPQYPQQYYAQQQQQQQQPPTSLYFQQSLNQNLPQFQAFTPQTHTTGATTQQSTTPFAYLANSNASHSAYPTSHNLYTYNVYPSPYKGTNEFIHSSHPLEIVRPVYFSPQSLYQQYLPQQIHHYQYLPPWNGVTAYTPSLQQPTQSNEIERRVYEALKASEETISRHSSQVGRSTN